MPHDKPTASLLRATAFALLAWAAFIAAMAMLPRIDGGTPPPWPILMTRTMKLVVFSKEFFLGPLALMLVVGLAGRVMRGQRPFSHAVRDGLRFGALAFGAAAVLWLSMAAWSLLEGQDPWEGLPATVPPYLEEFLARHPGMEVTTYGGTRQLRLHDGKGPSLFVDGDDIKDAAVRFEPCSPGDAEPAALGGIPPYPAARCETLLRVRRGDVERVVHVFVAIGDAGPEQVRQHFERWAESLGAAHGTSGGPNHYFFTARQDLRQWDLRLFVGRSRPTEIYIPRGGHTPQWAEARDQQWGR